MPPIETALLQNSALEVRLLSLGCITQSLRMTHWDADRSAVLGYADAAAYHTNPHYLGAVVGRVANRIENAAFTLNGQSHHIDANEGANTLHGGAGGISTRLWDMEMDKAKAVQFRLTSAHGDQGFPATVRFTVTVSLDANTLTYDLQAEVDAPTPINMTQHNYYNLGGSGTLDGHSLRVPASKVLATDAQGIPTQGETITNGSFDFQDRRLIEASLHADLDANYCLDAGGKALIELEKGNTHLNLTTSQTGVQIYTAGKLNETARPFGNQSHTPFSGICLEPQGYPNAVNRPDFPSVIVTPDAPYRNIITLTMRDGEIS